jgi:hypothetical protein
MSSNAGLNPLVMKPVLARTLLLMVAAVACDSNGTRASTQLVDTNKAQTTAAEGAPMAATRIEPELTPAMLRALKGYASEFQRFAASEYAPRVDTTYRADGDFNGDGIPDLALYGHDKTRELLLVLMSEADSSYRVFAIEDRKLEPFQHGAYVYLRTQPPGPLEIPTEFKKTLEPRPPERLRYAAVNVLYGNEAGELYYWDGKQFVKVITGD